MVGCGGSITADRTCGDITFDNRVILCGDCLRGEKDSIFINHIKDHLKEGQEVICKICGKSANEIIDDVSGGCCMNKLEGFIETEEEHTCSYSGCKQAPVISTIIKDKIEKLPVQKIHFWCKKHYDALQRESEVKG